MRQLAALQPAKHVEMRKRREKDPELRKVEMQAAKATDMTECIA